MFSIHARQTSIVMRIVFNAVALILLTGTELNAQCPPVYTFERPAGETVYGIAIDLTGDINGDGYSDIIVGSAGGAGSVWIYSGANGSILQQYEGSLGGDLLGYSVAFAGDVNDDGFGDFIIGAPGYDNENTDAGAAYVYSGEDWTLLWQWTGPNAFDELGSAVDGAGDINNDGFDDVIVGVPGIQGIGAGRVYIYSGQTGAVLDSVTEVQGGANLGAAVANLGDINFDGRNDIAIGAPGYDNGGDIDEGKVVVRSPNTQSNLFTMFGTTPGEKFGASVDGAGDWDNNGRRDIVVGSPTYPVPGADAGRVSVHSGATGTRLVNFTSGAAGYRLGTSVTGLEDSDGDGFSEIAAGAPADNSGGSASGAVIVYSGATEDTIGFYTGTPLPGANFGVSVSGGGDFNNDGFPDFAAGAPLDSTLSTSGGRAFVYALPVTSCFTANWDGRSGLYPDEACPQWELSADGVPLPTLVDTVLRFSLPELVDFESYRQTVELFNITYPWVIESRIRLVSGSSSFDAIAPAEIYFANGIDTANALHITADTIFVWTEVLGSAERGTIALVDTDDDFHTYRIVILNPLEFQLFYDDSLLFQDSMITGVGLTSPTRVSWGKLFGGSSGTSDWLFLRHTAYDSTIDSDGDGYTDCLDNCPASFNPLQEDFDMDGLGDSCFMPTYLRPLTVVARDAIPPTSPGQNRVVLNLPDPGVNLNVIDPDAMAIGADSFSVITNTIGDSAAYYQVAGNDSVVIDAPKTGTYIIEVIPEIGGGSGGAYTIGIRTDGTVENVFGPADDPLSGEIDTVFIDNIPYAFGDCDGSRSVNIGDVTYMIARIFAGGADCYPPESGDANCDGSFNIADATFLLAYIFSGGPAPGCE